MCFSIDLFGVYFYACVFGVTFCSRHSLLKYIFALQFNNFSYSLCSTWSGLSLSSGGADSRVWGNTEMIFSIGKRKKPGEVPAPEQLGPPQIPPVIKHESPR
jgi:hypothetical protein